MPSDQTTLPPTDSCHQLLHRSHLALIPTHLRRKQNPPPLINIGDEPRSRGIISVNRFLQMKGEMVIAPQVGVPVAGSRDAGGVNSAVYLPKVGIS